MPFFKRSDHKKHRPSEKSTTDPESAADKFTLSLESIGANDLAAIRDDKRVHSSDKETIARNYKVNNLRVILEEKVEE